MAVENNTDDAMVEVLQLMEHHLGRLPTALEIHEFLFGDLDARIQAFAVGFQPGRWWRVLSEDGTLWMETSDEQEARDGLRDSWVQDADGDDEELVLGDVVPGRKLQNLQVMSYTNTKWKDVE